MVDTGDGNDTINVHAISAALTVNAGNGDDTINVGGKPPLLGGLLSDIHGPLTINGDDGTDTLNLDDSGNTLLATLTLDGAVISGLGMSDRITLNSIENPGIDLGSGGNTVNIRSTDNAIRIRTGSGDDTVNVGSLYGYGVLPPIPGGTVNRINAQLTLDGQSGNDTLNVDDTGDTSANTGVLTAMQLTGLGMTGGIDYTNFETLEISLGSGGDTFMVNGTTRRSDFRTQTVVNTGAGNDKVTVSLDAAIDGPLVVNLPAGDDSINALASSLGLIVFGGAGADSITGGLGADIPFGDQGVVEYTNAAGALVTRSGIEPNERSLDSMQSILRATKTDRWRLLRGQPDSHP